MAAPSGLEPDPRLAAESAIVSLRVLLAPCLCAAWWGIAAAASVPAATLPAGPVSHVFLVQNSGWMEPFYSDPASPFKALVTELVLAVTQADDPIVLAAFNQALPGAPSPKALLAMKVDPASQRGLVSGALASLSTATKPGSLVLADTDLTQAVTAAINGALDRRAGLVWLITNNRNSPNNDLATARRNREFYALIHQGTDIRKALAFPLQMPVRSKHYSASGLMVYVFAIRDEGVAQLDALLRSGRIQSVITEPPARLKPLDRDTVRLAPVKVENAAGVVFSMADNAILRADVKADAHAPSAKISWKLENTMYPYTIASARLAARSVLAGENRPIALGGDQVRALSPGASLALASVLHLPAGQLPGKWSVQAMRSAGSAQVLPGQIEIRLSEQKLVLSQAFRQRMATLFPGDPLPDIFQPPVQVQGSVAMLPIEVRVHFGIAPLLTLIGAVLALLMLLGAALLALTRARKVQVTVEGELRTLHTRLGATQTLYDALGQQVAELKSTVLGHKLVHVREGAQVRLGR